ncbi:MAG TPA: hypothetical protein VM052_06670, partial [Candidatus Limnocylindrales bacterium]|nr:hypothetical protein [Candidatus Limnocylindrales bacterium]
LSPYLGRVKLSELEAALGSALSVVPRSIEADDDAWAAWAAGLFDGEGWSCTYAHRSHAGYVSGEIGVSQSAPRGEPEVLTRFNLVVGVGRIYGPYEQDGATMPVWRWKATAQRDVETVVARLWPWLDQVKRDQAETTLNALLAQAVLPRGNPAWGNNKTHCVNGHEYATARLRPYVARGAARRRRENQSCLVCLRVYARRVRDMKRPPVDDDPRSLAEHEKTYLLK